MLVFFFLKLLTTQFLYRTSLLLPLSSTPQTHLAVCPFSHFVTLRHTFLLASIPGWWWQKIFFCGILFVFLCSLLTKVEETLSPDLGLDRSQGCLEYVGGSHREPNTGNCVLGKNGLEKQTHNNSHKYKIWSVGKEWNSTYRKARSRYKLKGVRLKRLV